MTIQPAYRASEPTLTGPVYDVVNDEMYCDISCAANVGLRDDQLVEADAQPGDLCACCGKSLQT